MASSLFLRACRRQEVPRPPVWLMRQAGRYLPAYRQVRAKVDFLTLCKTPELASQVSIQPVEILGVDAAIIFSDILVVLEAIGLEIEFGIGEGPRIRNPIRNAQDIRALCSTDVAKQLSYVGKAIQLTKKALAAKDIPVIGFAGAPFTLACYAIEGKTDREFHQTKKWLNENPVTFARLLKKLADAIAEHLIAQVEAGAVAVQLFDTWGGLLGEAQYRTIVLPALQQAISRLKPYGVPVILYLKGSTPHLKNMAQSGADVLSVDWCLPLSRVRQQIGCNIGLQGNLDPSVLYSSPKTIASAARLMLKDYHEKGFIANLGHGILPDIPVEHVKTFINTVKQFKRK